MIGIIGAMQEEVSALLNKAEITKENKLLVLFFMKALLKEKKLLFYKVELVKLIQQFAFLFYLQIMTLIMLLTLVLLVD